MHMDCKQTGEALPANDVTTHRSVLIDGKNLSLRQGTGVASYARSLCDNLTAMGDDVHILYGEDISRYPNPEISFFDVHAKRRIETLPRLVEYVRGILAPPLPWALDFANSPLVSAYSERLPSANMYWNAPGLFDYPRGLLTRGSFASVENVMSATVAHWTYPVPLKLRDAANVYTLHDLVPLKLPDTTLDNKKSYFNLLQRIIEDADLIVTVSTQSKRDIHKTFRIKDEKVINTYQDVQIPETLLVESEENIAIALRGLYGLEIGNYLLFYGAIEPKKNVGRLIEAYLASGITLPLVIVGKDGWLMERELYLFNRHQKEQEPRIIRLEYVTRPQLVYLIRGARGVVFPSLYEGFGLPLVEAMLCGTPLLTSNHGAMKEIAADAALYVDPYDVSAIRDGLRKIVKDGGLRAELVSAGRARATDFSSENYQKRLAAAYGSLKLTT